MLYDSAQWNRDLEATVNVLPELQALSGKEVLITGISGLIGSAVADLLIQYNETHTETITIIAAGRDRSRLEQRFGKYSARDYFRFMPYDASAPDYAGLYEADYIIHCASNAFPAAIIKEPVETMRSNFEGLLVLLQSLKKRKDARLLFVSSSEVYGKKASMDPFREDEFGYIDLLNPRNSYSVGKRAAETLCASYSSEYGVDTVIVRPGHIYGPTASRKDNRISSAFAYDAAEGKNLIMKSDGRQIRSYCYCLDCASAILTVLLRGKSLNAYNISHAQSIISIKRMAEILAAAGNVELLQEKANKEELKSFNPMDNSSLNSEKLEALGWHGLFDADTGLSHTVRVIQEALV